ncbi:hypothetical protein AYI68_g1565 [Smittium mucronatum]|uniref:Uncharacterized protein n=1 Tax=Smittium mucronatum TaxID=133383 RepID=A0A1R0H564_9FUNG|nr:hypothetical protein AYI68_g1565 [Smittium mucronatum]
MGFLDSGTDSITKLEYLDNIPFKISGSEFVSDYQSIKRINSELGKITSKKEAYFNETFGHGIYKKADKDLSHSLSNYAENVENDPLFNKSAYQRRDLKLRLESRLQLQLNKFSKPSFTKPIETNFHTQIAPPLTSESPPLDFEITNPIPLPLHTFQERFKNEKSLPKIPQDIQINSILANYSGNHFLISRNNEELKVNFSRYLVSGEFDLVDSQKSDYGLLLGSILSIFREDILSYVKNTLFETYRSSYLLKKMEST